MTQQIFLVFFNVRKKLFFVSEEFLLQGIARTMSGLSEYQKVFCGYNETLISKYIKTDARLIFLLRSEENVMFVISPQ